MASVLVIVCYQLRLILLSSKLAVETLEKSSLVKFRHFHHVSGYMAYGYDSPPGPLPQLNLSLPLAFTVQVDLCLHVYQLLE